jgi:hypothetical protein
LNGQGYILPEILPKEGLIVKEEGRVDIAIWIMPNNDVNGMLEDFITFLVPEEDVLMPVVEANINMIEEGGLNKYKPVHRSKAIIHSWLSLQEDPGTPMGLSVTKKYLTTNKDICLNFVAWLNKSFNE